MLSVAFYMFQRVLVRAGHTLHVKQWQGLLDTTLATQFLVVGLVAVNFTKEVGGWGCVKAASRLHSRADLHLQQRLNCGLACFTPWSRTLC